MIKNTNVNIKITLSKDQANWLEKQAKTLHLNKSKYIAWILSKKANEIAEYLYLKKGNYQEQELEEMIRIAKTPWIKPTR